MSNYFDQKRKTKNLSLILKALVILIMVSFIFGFFASLASAKAIGQISNNLFIMLISFSIIELLFFTYLVLTIKKEYIWSLISEISDLPQKLIFIFLFMACGLYLFISINFGLIHFFNQKLDKSQLIKRYLIINNKRSYTTQKKKGGPATYHFEISISSWVNEGSFKIEVAENTYNYLNIKDIITATTKSGFFGIAYFKSLDLKNKVDPKIFPENTKFPITEEELEKLRLPN